MTLGSKKLSEHEGRLLKKLSGSLVLELGALLLLKPELFSNIMVSVADIGGAILLTALVVLVQKLKA